MQVIVGSYPPLIEEINAAFQIKGLPVFFAWGDKIYNPLGQYISPELIAHEEMHGQRQGDDVEGWWHRYIADQKFRLIEEVLAHVAEYNHLLHMHGVDRHTRRKALAETAIRLINPLYKYNPRPNSVWAKRNILETHKQIEANGYVPAWTENANFLTL